MTNNAFKTDTKPWYKQFWPWFIIALPASAVIAGITTVFIAFENADSLVVDDYYKEGKAINQRVALLKRARDMGLKAELQRLARNRLVLTFDSNIPPVKEIASFQITILIFHHKAFMKTKGRFKGVGMHLANIHTMIAGCR